MINTPRNSNLRNFFICAPKTEEHRRLVHHKRFRPCIYRSKYNSSPLFISNPLHHSHRSGSNPSLWPVFAMGSRGSRQRNGKWDINQTGAQCLRYLGVFACVFRDWCLWYMYVLFTLVDVDTVLLMYVDNSFYGKPFFVAFFVRCLVVATKTRDSRNLL